VSRREKKDTELLELGKRHIRPQRVAASHRGVIATQHYRATEAGARVLGAGGNAFDAAVAAAFALGVCEPAASGLGGQTMLLLKASSGRVIALDGSSRAPNRATPELLRKRELRRGYRATTVPSTPAVLGYVLERYGRLGLQSVLAPAIELAEEGYKVSELQHSLILREKRHLLAGTAAPFFLRDGKKSYRPGSVLRQPVLAQSLRRIASEGIEDFYKGGIADLIHQDMERNDGLLHRDDLAQVPYPVERRPLTCRFRNRRVFTFPPPAAGRTLVEMLQVLEQLSPKDLDIDTPRGAHALVEVVRQAGLDRQDRPFDPDFYPQVVDKKMLSLEYAQRIARRIRKRIRRPGGETTHLSAMDHEGNAVALTQSIERVFGSCSVTPELGFLYNNYMSAYEYDDISHPYYLRPNAVPWASVAPTLIFSGRRPWLAIGSPGSERIVSSIVQVLLRLERQIPLDAVTAPRLHCSVKGRVSLEASRMRDDISERLGKHGYEIDARDPYSFYLGCVQMVMREGKEFIGVADPRRDGAAGGSRT
jgi:gamma-glutamyltranspeptidase/glutathione hydrolase